VGLTLDAATNEITCTKSGASLPDTFNGPIQVSDGTEVTTIAGDGTVAITVNGGTGLGNQGTNYKIEIDNDAFTKTVTVQNADDEVVETETVTDVTSGAVTEIETVTETDPITTFVTTTMTTKTAANAIDELKVASKAYTVETAAEITINVEIEAASQAPDVYTISADGLIGGTITFLSFDNEDLTACDVGLTLDAATNEITCTKSGASLPDTFNGPIQVSDGTEVTTIAGDGTVSPSGDFIIELGAGGADASTLTVKAVPTASPPPPPTGGGSGGSPAPVPGVPDPVPGVPDPVPGVPDPVPDVPDPVPGVPDPVPDVPVPDPDVPGGGGETPAPPAPPAVSCAVSGRKKKRQCNQKPAGKCIFQKKGKRCLALPANGGLCTAFTRRKVCRRAGSPCVWTGGRKRGSCGPAQ